LDLAYTLSGFVVGAIVGITGVGGGSLMTPLLVLLCEPDDGSRPPMQRSPRLAESSSGGGATSVGHRRPARGRRLPGALATIAVLSTARISTRPAKLVTESLGIALILTAFAILFRTGSAVGPRQAVYGANAGSDRSRCWRFVLGVLVTLSSVGAGAIGATLIMLIYPRLESHRIVGTDIAHAVPLTFVAGIGHATLGHVDWGLLGALLIGSVPGIWLGSALSARVPDGLLRSGSRRCW
jgi:uncharacterized membrane protein YfcA